MAMDQSAAAAKKCSKCGEVKGLGEFHVRPESNDGRRGTCKECHRSMRRAWYADNIDRERQVRAAAAIEKYRADPEKGRAQQRAWRLANRDAMSRRYRDVYAKNRDALIERCRLMRARLDSSYVMQTLRLKAADRKEAPPALIALKREQLAIKRMARELKKAATQQDGATP